VEQRQRALHEQRDSSKKGISHKELGVGDKKKEEHGSSKKILFFSLGALHPLFFPFFGGGR
jgi:hypothetical protein